MVCKGTCKVVVRLKAKCDLGDNAVQCVEDDQASLSGSAPVRDVVRALLTRRLLLRPTEPNAGDQEGRHRR